MLKRFYSLTLVLLCSMMTAWAADVTYAPTLDVCFRTGTGNTAWNSGYPKNAADEGNTVFESNYYAGIFTMQKYTVADLANASKLTLTITVNSGGSGVDGTWLWLYPNSDWTAATGVDDIVPKVTELIGIAPRSTEGTVKDPLAKGAKVAGSDPAKGVFTISGSALTALKASATSDGTFTVLISNNKLLETNNSRKYQSSNAANAEANRPTLVATIASAESFAVTNTTTGVGYKTLNEAFDALTGDANIVLNDNSNITARCTLKEAYTVNVTAAKDVTLTGPKNAMWLLANKNGAKINFGDENHTITLDGRGSTNEQVRSVVKYENSAEVALTNVKFTNFKLTKDGSTIPGLIDTHNSNGLFTLKNITVSGSSAAEGGALFMKTRVTNDRVVLQGFLNVESDCTGTVFYLASETKSSGTTGRIKIDDDAFTASSDITIEWPGTKADGIVVVIGTKAANASLFKLTDSEWRLERKSNGDLIMKPATTDLGPWLEFQQGSYTHPGLLHTTTDINAVKTRLTAGEELATAAYSRLEAQSGGTAAGAVEYLKRMDKANWESKYSDYSNYTHAATDAKLAYELALRYQLKGSTAAATAAVNILNDWAANCKGVLRIDDGTYANNVPDPNEYLITIQAYQFANAAELLRDYSGWQAADFTAFKTWMRNTFGELAYRFLANHHANANALHYWLNWDLACLSAMLSVGILCDDAAMVNYALAYPTSGAGTGNVANAVIATHQDPDSDETLAQCQESGRDQGHATLDITLLGVLCQTAQNQGTDLFTPYKALEMAEYVGKYNLKNSDGTYVYTADKVPFTAYNNGEVDHTVIAEAQRGTERPCWELFHAYAKKNSKADAYTEGWVKYMRAKNAYGEAESTATDELGFGSLMFGAEVTASGIQTLRFDEDQQGAVVYDLQGRRVDHPQKGLYIVNGKKLMMK